MHMFIFKVSETGLELDRCRQEQEAVTVEFYSFKVNFILLTCP
jgi:hypothetical protein